MQNKLAIFLLGPPGSGKNTQAKLLAEKLNLKTIDSGNIVRYQLKNNSKAKKIYNQGRLIPSKIMYEWVKQEMAKNKNKSFIFSGALRTLYEAKKIIPYLEKDNYQVKIINIDISPKQSIARNSKRARDIADKPEKIQKRLVVYQKQTKPVLKFLNKKVININGEQDIKNVHKDICDALGREAFSANHDAGCAGCQAKCPLAGLK